ncbi:hypothetical protein Mapa_004071 [Marchantia paleacea]|nr:hypothetical protein Mapa_004071 [Marchantia paleacea]
MAQAHAAMSSSDSVSSRKRQKLFAAAGAAVTAVYQSVTINPSVFFPGDDEEDIYCSKSIYENEDILGCNTNYAYIVEAATLATAAVVGVGEIEMWKPGVEEQEKDVDNDEDVVNPGGCWFNTYLLDVWDEDRWIQHMKMSRRTFLRLVEHLVPAFLREPLWNDVSVEKKVGATIYRLINATDIPELGEKFAMDSYIVQAAIGQSVRAINWRLGHLIAWPKGKVMEKVTQDFQTKSCLPNCCGALGNCHIPVVSEFPGYRNKKGTYSVVLQALCDSQSKFLDIGCGWSGATRPTRVLRNSIFLEKVNRKEVLSGPKVQINAGFWVRQYVVGDGRYPHLSWLLAPYDDDTLTYSKECFNKAHERCRSHIVRTFDIFQSTFRLLAQPTNHTMEFLPHLVFAACLLHNFLIEVKEVGVEQTLMSRSSQEGTAIGDEAGIDQESADSIRTELMELVVHTT